jgi:hypothetical protein
MLKEVRKTWGIDIVMIGTISRLTRLSYCTKTKPPEYTTVDGSFINCTKFIDANGRIYYDGIPAIRLE